MHDDREYVQLHKDMFLKLQKNAQAAKQLNALLQEKEDDLKWHKDKAVQYEKEVSRLEERLSNVMKFQLSTAMSTTDSLKQKSTSVSVQEGNLSSERKQSSYMSSSMSNRGFPQAFTLPGVSKTMFDNVVRDNIKMKRLLQDALKKDGRELKSFLESKEYEDIIKQLRLKITQKEQEIARLNTIHVGDSQELINKLKTKISTLEKSLLTKQTLLESLNHEVESMKKRPSIREREEYKSSESGFETIPSVDRLIEEKAQVDDTDSKPAETDDMKQLKEEHQKATANYQNTIASQQADITELKSEKEEILKQCQEYAANFEELRSWRRQAESKEAEMHKRFDSLRKEFDVCKAEKSQLLEKCDLMETQLKVYKEDFETEAKEKQVMRKRYEEDISRQQIHIRKLSTECEKLNMLLMQEKMKSKVSSVSIQPALCGFSETSPWRSNQPLPMYGLVSDGEVTDCAEFSCPRCGSKFSDNTTFQEHINKCTRGSSDSRE